MLMDRGVGKVDGTIVCFVKECVIGRLGHVAEHVKESGYGVGIEDVANGKEGGSAIFVGRMVDNGLFHGRGDRRPRRCA